MATKALAGRLDSSATKLRHSSVKPELTQVEVIADDPVRGLGRATREQLMITQLNQIMSKVENGINLVSAYFAPGKLGADLFEGLERSGKQVRILTSAMNTTDVLVVHAVYTKYCPRLLKAGVELFELDLRAEQFPGREELKPLGRSGAALHAKIFSVDDRRVFIGSFHFDPHSALLNCEMGFLINTPTMARRVSEGFERPLKIAFYQPILTLDDKMAWTEVMPSGKFWIYQREQGSSCFSQIAIVVIGFPAVE